MEIKDSWIKQAKVDSQTYEIKYKTSLDDNDNFWREEGKRLDWVNNYTKIKDVKYSKMRLVLSGIMMGLLMYHIIVSIDMQKITLIA